MSTTEQTPAPAPSAEDSVGVPEHGMVKRFTRWQRATHAVLAVSVFGLVLTGMPLLYNSSFWAGPLMSLYGGPKNAGTIHRICAVLFMLSGAMHVAGLIAGLIRRDVTPLRSPDSMLPRVKDARQVVQNLRYLRGKGPQPKFSKYSYFEKFDYFAEIWGLFIIGLSGLILWFPVTAAKFLPGWAVNAALIFHSYEALLAMGFIFTIHFINTHLRPDTFPVDRVIFSGTMPLHEVKERYGDWYERVVSDPKRYIVPEEENQVRALNFVSGTFLIVGFTIFGLAMISALTQVIGYLINTF